MANIKITGGTAHKLPSDMKEALASDKKALDAWESLTPLARNEWICWTISVTLDETRKNHVERTITELKEGQRRPCCWYGCIHRKDKKISASVQSVIDKRSKNRWAKSR